MMLCNHPIVGIRRFRATFLAAIFALSPVLLLGCKYVDDNRVPSLPVNINLGDSGTWDSYGVGGFGMHRYFIPQLGQPAGFHYIASTSTGFGGVLLISGMDPFSVDTHVPLAYDLACPVECDRQVRVRIEGERYDAVCPKCGSHFDVTMRGGAPISGEAAQQNRPMSLRRYRCEKTLNGGYLIIGK